MTSAALRLAAPMLKLATVRITPLVVVMFVVAARATGPWQAEWRASCWHLLFVSPLVVTILAGCAAWDGARIWRPTQVSLGDSISRRWSVPLLVVAAALAVGLVGALGGLAQIALASESRLSGRVDVLFAVELAAGLAAAAGIGVALGARTRSPFAPAYAMGVVYGSYAVGSSLGLYHLAGTATVQGSLFALERDTWLALLSVLGNSIVAVVGVIAAVGSQPRRTLRVVTPLAVILVLALAAVARDRERSVGEFARGDERSVCVGQQPTVCGPAVERATLEGFATLLSEATVRVTASGLPMPRRVNVLAPGEVPPPNSHGTWVYLSAAELRDERSTLVAAVIASPTPCADFLVPTERTASLLDSQYAVGQWVQTHLDRATVPQAPPPIQAMYHDLASCRAVQ